MMDYLVGIPVALLLVAAGVLTLTGSLGLLRMSTFFKRIHAPTLGNTLGVFCVLVATILLASTHERHLVVHPILITIFLFITSPVTAMLLMRAAIRRKAEELQENDEVVIAQGPSDTPAAEPAPVKTPESDQPS
ncbi:monovalent cation/H(+) antiporter subunit G [Allopusillimonas ginsengisoli]|uniref:monovalent cation/H(+) antiporter subunit G n=1 Tax=Allopusillimonas ginsengisoli TaxID=453575 RepID=UPI001020AF4D|nr:monovalent cation/H(+) antiporter subunit G [Allopusillimonas ginsengisoli]TEA74249.1 cation:proton antiporter [Allopusillimonas ginsengisoli]